MTTDDLPTLRLVTLRRLLSNTVPPLVFDTSANIAAMKAALRDSPSSIAVLVDHDNILHGTVCLADLAAVDGAQPASTVMATATPVLAAENDVEAAYLEMFTHHADRVLVVDPTGRLLGVLTMRDLTERRAA